MIRERVYASFPWYDLPEMRAATDAFWRALAAAFAAHGIRDVPPALDRERPHGTDAEGACRFTQTCGYPLWTTARGHFHVLGAPRYAVPGCAGHLHRSFVVVRAASHVRAPADLRGARFAVNESDSNSGMNLPRKTFAPLASVRAALFLTGMEVCDEDAYDVVLACERDAVALGYPLLA